MYVVVMSRQGAWGGFSKSYANPVACQSLEPNLEQDQKVHVIVFMTRRDASGPRDKINKTVPLTVVS